MKNDIAVWSLQYNIFDRLELITKSWTSGQNRDEGFITMGYVQYNNYDSSERIMKDEISRHIWNEVCLCLVIFSVQ
jgi:hypothetical protein